jgi:hypothetical protein
MTPSERIKFIKNISSTLGAEDWSLIDLTLRQFGLPSTDSWEGNGTVPYVIDMISDAKDESLIELARHLNLKSLYQTKEAPQQKENQTESGANVSTSFWQPNQARVFLSHHSSIKSETILLKKALEEHSIVPFVAHEDIEPTKEWQTEIELALSTMDALVALLSPGFKESDWTDQEVGVAVGRRIPIVPVRIDLDPYGFIGKYQALQGRGRAPEQVALGIFEILTTKPIIGEKLTEGLVEKFIHSESWATAKYNMSLLEKWATITPEMSARLKKAVEENGEIGNSFGVPERLDKLLLKF